MALVAPHVGAWIETIFYPLLLSFFVVAPHVGAWIETSAGQCQQPTDYVAPHVGAWIETVASLSPTNAEFESHLT